MAVDAPDGLAFAGLFQVHLWLAIGLGALLVRRWRKKWAAIGVATAFYASATSALSFVPFSPSAYLVLALSMLVDRWSGAPSTSRVFVVGIGSLFVVVFGIPTGAAWLLRRRWA
jgi:hypothetical protein